MTAHTIADLDRLPERIKASADHLADLTAQATNERKIRDELIVQAVDEAGLTMAAVSRAAGISQPHIVRILANSSSD